MYTGSLIIKAQESYLQSKNYNKQKALTGGYDTELMEIKPEVLIQNNESFNNFIRQFSYKNLLFRSFWFNKFISTLVKCGKKQLV